MLHLLWSHNAYWTTVGEAESIFKIEHFKMSRCQDVKINYLWWKTSRKSHEIFMLPGKGYLIGGDRKDYG